MVCRWCGKLLPKKKRKNPLLANYDSMECREAHALHLLQALETAQAVTEAELRAEAEKQGLGQAIMGDLGEILQTGSPNPGARFVGAAMGRLASAIAEAMGPRHLRNQQAQQTAQQAQAAQQQGGQRRGPSPWVGPPPGFRPGGQPFGGAPFPPPPQPQQQGPPPSQPPPKQEQWQPPPPPRRSVNPEVVTLLRRLSLPVTATWDDVEKRYKDLARSLHPDAGGDGRAMSELNTTKNRLKELMAKK